MLAKKFWMPWARPADSGELEELRRNTVLEIAGLIFAGVWVMLIAGYGQPESLVVPFILLACSLGSVWLRQIDFRLALAWLVATLLAALAFAQWLMPGTPVQYFFPLVVVISSLLVSSLDVFVVAIASSAVLLVLARLQGVDWLDGPRSVTPVLLTLLTAGAAWIGSRQMHLALDWTRHSYARANGLLEELRDERASLARTLNMLEDAYIRIEKMNYALIEARSVAENARQLKAEFAANISHELRTPLNLIIGFSETMANAPETYVGVTWSPALRGDIEQIYQSSRHLSSLIDDILDLSALDARRLGLALETAAVDDVIAQATAMMQDLFRAKSLSLQVEIEPHLPPVRMDPTRIRQVLINLLTNASRFTQVGGVRIQARRSGEEIELAVQDTGIGIAPEDVPKVFEEFGQVDGSTTRKHEGSGLGVPLSKRLVESHGGRMWLESVPGVGTTFFFTLPVSMSSSSSSPAFKTSALAVPASRKSLLAYEPDPLLLKTMRRHLAGYDVIEVSAKDNLAERVEQEQPVALVVNTEEGGSVVLQEDGVPRDLPIIQVGLAGNLRAAQALAVHSFLLKPVLREQLLDALRTLPRQVHRVLIVDDDPEVVELLARMLQSAGQRYQAIKTFGAREGLARLKSERIDLVLLDLWMPGLDGTALLEEMKRDPALREIPVIIISGQYADLTATECALHVSLARAAPASTTETLNYLQALVAALPLRGLPAPAGAQA